MEEQNCDVKTFIVRESVDEFERNFPVSRSGAREFCSLFGNCRTVILDFSGLEMISPSWAHEIFTVFSGNHPEIKFRCVNTSERVSKILRWKGYVSEDIKETETKNA